MTSVVKKWRWFTEVGEHDRCRDAGCFGTLAVATLLTLLVTGCQQFTKQTTPEQRVTARAEARWQAMVRQDYAEAYKYLSPGVRLKVDEFAFAKRFKNKTVWHTAEVTGVTCETEKCQVELLTEFTILAVPPYSVDLRRKGDFREDWVLLDGEWWFAPRR